MLSADILATALRNAGLDAMADKAVRGYYHDFHSPLALPAMQLAEDLAAVGTSEALAIRARHINGEFDAHNDEDQ